jgi:hypothetical protein
MTEESVHASNPEFDNPDDEFDASEALEAVDVRASEMRGVPANPRSQPPPLPVQRRRSQPVALAPVAVAAFLGAVLGGGVYAFAERAHSRAAAREQQAAAVEAAPAAASDVVAVAPKAPEPAAAAEPEAEDKAPAAASEPEATPESKLLDSARSLLEEGKAAKAKAALDQARRKFPHGALIEEREYLQIASLKALKKMPAAKHAAQIFAKAHPDSAHLTDLEPLLGATK